MELLDYLRVMRERWLLVLGTLVVALAAATGITLAATPLYTASSQIYVSVTSTDGSTASLAQGSSFSQGQVTAFADLATSPLVLEPVVDTLGLRTSSGELSSSIEATTTRDTPLIAVAVTDADPEQAAALSAAVSESMTQVIPELQRPAGAAASPVKLTITRYAQVPTAPSSPDLLLNVGIGGVLGLVGGIALALVAAAADTRIRSLPQLAQVSDAAVLGQVTYEKEVRDHPLAVIGDARGRVAEAVRQVRTNLTFVGAGSRPQCIVVTSAIQGEGKSTTAANLALALAEAGERVLLVDGDLRRPSVAGMFGLEQAAGLTTVLVGRATAADVVQHPHGTTLEVLASGVLPPNPSEILGSPPMHALLTELRETYDTIVIDSPPLLPVADGSVLSKIGDGVLLVVGSRVVRKAQTRQALATLELIEARLLGTVLNGLDASRAPSYEYYYVEPAAKPRRASLFSRSSRSSSAAAGSPERASA